jgi:hypothetical protein
MYILKYIYIYKYTQLTIVEVKIMVRKSVTLSIESEIYDKFKRQCLNEGVVLSKKVEQFMAKETKK